MCKKSHVPDPKDFTLPFVIKDDEYYKFKYSQDKHLYICKFCNTKFTLMAHFDSVKCKIARGETN